LIKIPKDFKQLELEDQKQQDVKVQEVIEVEVKRDKKRIF